MIKDKFRNIAIIAHVDHGKTTLVDAMLKQSGTYRDNEHVEERVMDSMDQEKERGITISAKNTAVYYEGRKINIMDTPGHADFGGEVERSLSIVDGAILLVDSSEGPLPQTRFVVKKALNLGLPIILVINKIDRPDGRIAEVIEEVYDLFIDVDATDEQIDFPILYTIGKEGIAKYNLEDESTDLKPLFDTIIEKIPGPTADDSHETQFLAASLDYDNYVGQIAIGRVWNGLLEMNKQYALSAEDGIKRNQKLNALYSFTGLSKTQVDSVESGDIVAIAGIEDIKIGDTVTDNENPKPMDRIKIDEPTVSMIFYVNNSPFAGTEGKFVTSRHLKARLDKEVKLNVSLRVSETDRTDAFKVSGRGELQLGVLIETMRREGFELMVSKPTVITKEIDGKTCEPYEEVFIDVPDEYVGVVTEKLQNRKGQLVNMMSHGHGRTDIEFLVPSRGLIGYRSQFMTDTKGSGIINNLFHSYKEWAGDISQRSTGVLVSDRAGKTTEYACIGMEDRGILIVGIGVKVYMGMVVGERNKPGDLNINIVREKQLTNMRASGSDNTVSIRPHKQLSLDASIEFLSEDELLEITPESIRIRKAVLDPNQRKKTQKG
ncbi:MAG: translational GTPase TypA [Candidatus Kapaibacterium sp.]|nr:translational GTPase TypA [Ignavibacteriota bacterium]MCB9222035.1 translational GTPase TypA [Ignavibacteria bacterium]